MTYFNIFNIIREGEIENPAKIRGAEEELLAVSKIGLEKYQGNDTHFIVEVDYERIVNGNSLFKIKVKTIWLINGLNKKEEERELFFLRTLILRSVSHLYGQLSCKYQDNNWLMILPHNDPDYVRAFKLTKIALRDFFKAQ